MGPNISKLLSKIIGRLDVLDRNYDKRDDIMDKLEATWEQPCRTQLLARPKD